MNSSPRWLTIWRPPASRTDGGRAVGPGMRRFGSKRLTVVLPGRRGDACGDGGRGDSGPSSVVDMSSYDDASGPRSCSTPTCSTGSTATSSASTRPRPRSSPRPSRRGWTRTRRRPSSRSWASGAAQHGRLSLDGRLDRAAGGGPATRRPLSGDPARPVRDPRRGRRRRPQPPRGRRLVRAGRRAAAAGRARARRAGPAAAARARARRRRGRSLASVVAGSIRARPADARGPRPRRRCC